MGRVVVEDRLPAVVLHFDRIYQLGIESRAHMCAILVGLKCRTRQPPVVGSENEDIGRVDGLLYSVKIEAHGAVSRFHPCDVPAPFA